MRLLLQRVKSASVSVAGREIASIGQGLLAFVGFGAEDGRLHESRVWESLLKKTIELRIFPDVQGKLNRCLLETGGGMLAVSQFTLYADCRKGRRPSFSPAAPPDMARELYERFLRDMEGLMPGKIESGSFGEEMEVSLVNWGPVTIALSSGELLKPRR